MRKFRIFLVLIGLSLLLAACGVRNNAALDLDDQYDREAALKGFQKGGCSACHTIPGVPGATGTIGPDLSKIGAIAEARLENGEYTGKAKTAHDYPYEL